MVVRGISVMLHKVNKAEAEDEEAINCRVEQETCLT